MALARTTLSAPITASQLTFGVASTANAAFPAVGGTPVNYQPIWVDDECMFLVSCPATNIVTVRMRGSDGTDAVAHDTGSSVVTSATPAQDFPVLQPGASTYRTPQSTDIVTYATAGAIAVPVEPVTIVYLAPTSAVAFTLAAPSVASNGSMVTFTNQVAFGSTITVPGVSGSTGLFYTAAASSPFTVATMGSLIGSSFTVVAQNGAWNVVNASITAVTFA